MLTLLPNSSNQAIVSLMPENKSLLHKITNFIAWLLGSWIGVLLHTIWFGSWIYFDLPMEKLTLTVSLEAIYIGIFLLMAANEAEAAREAKEKEEREKDRTKLHADVTLDEKQLKIIKSMKKEIQHIKAQIEKLDIKG